MPYHISSNNAIAFCKARPGNCPLRKTMEHLSTYSLDRILKGTPVTDREKDICLRLKTGELALDYTVPGQAADPTIKRLARPSRTLEAGTRAYSHEESGIRGLFQPGGTFARDGKSYTIIACDKPQVGGGEPKADVFIAARNVETNEVEHIKISYKMNSGEFGENKLTAEQAERILGKDYKAIVKAAATQLNLPSRIAKHANRASYPLGYRLDIMLPKHGAAPAHNSSYVPLQLDQADLEKIYTGRGGPKADAYVTNYNSNVLVKDAGVADYILFEQDLSSAQDAIDKMIPINEYVKQQPVVFVALKAVNYRMDKHRQGAQAWDGDRPLAVPVDWELTARNELIPSVNLDQIFDHKANFRGAAFKRLLVRSNRG